MRRLPTPLGRLRVGGSMSTVRQLTLFAAVGLVATAGAVPVSATDRRASPSAAERPYILEDGVSAPVYSYRDAIREHVVVSAPDHDGDAARDSVAVDIIRPRELDRRTPVPVIMVASPYFACCGRGNEGELKTYGRDGSPKRFPLFYDNYFVPRGYGVVLVDMAGTNRSDGCADSGSASDIGSVKAVVDWLNGRVDAVDAAGRPANADWTDGTVGLIGKSYDGALANGVAATGVEGLETIVPIAAISSWYDHMRYGGLPRVHDHASGLAEAVARQRTERDPDCARLTRRMAAEDGDRSGAYTAFWSARDYRRAPAPGVGRVHASVFIVHGLQDVNVGPPNFSQWWSALGRAGVQRKMWLSRLGHVEPFDHDRPTWVRTLHRWFDRELMGIRNGILREPRVRVEVAPDTWRTSDVWPVGDGSATLRPRAGGRLSPGGGEDGQASFMNDPYQTERVAITRGPNANRLLFISDRPDRPTRISGTPAVRVSVRTHVPVGQLAVILVDYGRSERVVARDEGVRTLGSESCFGRGTPYDDACYFDVERRLGTPRLQVIARGWARLAGAGRHTITVPLTANDVRVPAGHRLGLAIMAASSDWVATVDESASRYVVSLGGSKLHLDAALRFRADSGAAEPLGADRRTGVGARAARPYPRLSVPLPLPALNREDAPYGIFREPPRNTRSFDRGAHRTGSDAV
jgi:X-Pro dipeptidyl-peptidase